MPRDGASRNRFSPPQESGLVGGSGINKSKPTVDVTSLSVVSGALSSSVQFEALMDRDPSASRWRALRAIVPVLADQSRLGASKPRIRSLLDVPPSGAALPPVPPEPPLPPV